MDRELEILKVKQELEDFQMMLKVMPEDTLLGRLCIKAYIKRAEKKLKKLLEDE